ncbi:uncharacterized protein LOC107484806 [Arachis duranensis]|uniref:Uncharacterized protein LOC107484806 n=1 Tax=Arachis duranensis TaxID=130453 RepID=A0A6P4D803_ARADU|nr:uncharacterized protein LOC107484806 [Arachis duranensis]
MEENSRLGETPKFEFSNSSRDKDKYSKKKDDPYGEKINKYNNYTPLRVSLVEVYIEVCHTKKILPPRPLKSKKEGGNRTEYCEYHRIYGHPTNECLDLKNVIEKLVREGRLDWYLASKTDEPRKRRRDEEVSRTKRPLRTLERHVHMIHGGFAGGGITESSHKRNLKDLYHVEGGEEAPELPTITFTKEDAAGVISGYDDPMLITIILANANLHRTLVDQGSRTTLNQLGAVVSTPHLCTKFPTAEGITMIKGDQKMARHYYNESLKLRGK